jgi:membrane protein
VADSQRGGSGSGSVTDESLADLVSRVSEHASTLIREEIELAKAEIELKTKRLAQGAAVGAAAGFFVFLALIFLFQALAYGLADVLGNAYLWGGFLITTAILLALAGLAGFLAMRAFRAGAPPTPQKAIEEAKLIRQTIEHPEIEAAKAGMSANGPDA